MFRPRRGLVRTWPRTSIAHFVQRWMTLGLGASLLRIQLSLHSVCGGGFRRILVLSTWQRHTDYRIQAARWRTGRDSMAAVAVSGLAGNIDGCMNLYYGLASCLGPAPATKLVQNPRSGRWESSADACSVIRLMAAQHPMADLLAR